MKTPTAPRLNGRFPLHAISAIDADGLTKDVYQGTMGQVVKHTVARGNGKLVALSFELLNHLAGLATVDITCGSIQIVDERFKGCVIPFIVVTEYRGWGTYSRVGYGGQCES